MDKKIAGLLGAAAAITTVTGAHAAPAQLAPASYRELLEPIPNAAALLKADDQAREQMTPAARIEKVQYYHHHHHHGYYHHHHHHHHGYYNPGAAIVGGVIGGLLAGPQPACYWTYGQPVWNGYAWVRPRVQVCP